MSFHLNQKAKDERWHKKTIIELNGEGSSISSEEETGPDFDAVQNLRSKSNMEIWDSDHIWNQLQTLPDAKDIINLINIESSYKLFIQNPNSLLLIATWLKNAQIVKKVLQRGGSVDARDEEGRTALHLAAYTGSLHCLKLLLEHGASTSVVDFVHKVTPLHCAASKGEIACVRHLIEHGAHVNSEIGTKSSLFYAVQGLHYECVKELLEAKAIPNSSQIFSETPLHVAATLGASEIIQLLLNHGAAVNVQYGSEKVYPLHLAAEDGNIDSVRLLIEAGADLSVPNNKNQTPLHLAALSQCLEALELLLAKGANPNAKDKDGRTPLHSAIIKVSHSCECIRILRTGGANVNQQDLFGYTPLHLAALNECSNCVMLLINHGGDVTVRTNGGISVLTFITRKTPDVIPRYVSKFDASIKLNDHDIGDVDCELKLDFRVMVPTMGNQETELLLHLIEVGHREVLKHPLCETFLFLKWRRIRKFFLFSLFYHSVFVILYSIYTIGVYVNHSSGNLLKVTAWLLLFLNVMMVCKELFQIFHSWYSYIKEWENWLQWSIILSVFCCVKPNLEPMPANGTIWQDDITAIGIFLSWVEMMMIIGRFPIFGLYIQMFTTVSINFFKFIAAYVCLLLAFALSFGVLFSEYKSFENLKWIMVKVLVMMSGELEYEDIFYSSPNEYSSHWTAQIMFLAYVILVAVILTNLMVGLAVSDIQGLQQSAGLDRLVRQAELVAHLESMLFSRLLKCIPHKIMKSFLRKALLLKSQYQWALYIKPNDPREERIPRDIIKNIYNLVVERKEKPKVKLAKINYNLSSPPLSRMNSSTSSVNDLKMELEEISRDFVDFSRSFRQKIDAITHKLNVKKLDLKQ